jgi:hypothetical protein
MKWWPPSPRFSISAHSKELTEMGSASADSKGVKRPLFAKKDEHLDLRKTKELTSVRGAEVPRPDTSAERLYCQVIYCFVIVSNRFVALSGSKLRSWGRSLTQSLQRRRAETRLVGQSWVSQDSQGERFCRPNRVFAAGTVGMHSRQFTDFCDPAAIFFAVGLNLEVVAHCLNHVIPVGIGGIIGMHDCFCQCVFWVEPRSGVGLDRDVDGAGAEGAD